VEVVEVVMVVMEMAQRPVGPKPNGGGLGDGRDGLLVKSWTRSDR
jgi:hypothetical protein